jgi:hypothetical protein
MQGPPSVLLQESELDCRCVNLYSFIVQCQPHKFSGRLSQLRMTAVSTTSARTGGVNILFAYSSISVHSTIGSGVLGRINPNGYVCGRFRVAAAAYTCKEAWRNGDHLEVNVVNMSLDDLAGVEGRE